MILYLIITYLIGFGQAIYTKCNSDDSIGLLLIYFIVSPLSIPLVIGATLEKFHDEN